MKAVEWLEELGRRVSKIREVAEENIGKAQSKRKERHDKKAVVRKFEVGNKVLTRVPGLHNKLEGSWEGPFVALDVPSDFMLFWVHRGKHAGEYKGREYTSIRVNPFWSYLYTG